MYFFEVYSVLTHRLDFCMDVSVGGNSVYTTWTRGPFLSRPRP